jgi:hypothetical protein
MEQTEPGDRPRRIDDRSKPVEKPPTTPKMEEPVKKRGKNG